MDPAPVYTATCPERRNTIILLTAIILTVGGIFLAILELAEAEYKNSRIYVLEKRGAPGKTRSFLNCRGNKTGVSSLALKSFFELYVKSTPKRIRSYCIITFQPVGKWRRSVEKIVHPKNEPCIC